MVFQRRDHIQIKNLMKEWRSETPIELPYFVPSKYHLKFAFTEFGLSLNANDHNIIEKANDLDTNGT